MSSKVMIFEKSLNFSQFLMDDPFQFAMLERKISWWIHYFDCIWERI